ncbi:hypothetical protein FLP10_07455 [Agromyces intestinalis]|uniref:Uncharacterized protein n=1 Tax=Agromyces intestinalis TaxID=2592652 RepID=A0A5C1YHN0_9MICO|nr:hypothetical protein [Agromyces intestinalis]QEO14272.1 hypothetical protein FLP10_07455 [Agromyces intestinalis]
MTARIGGFARDLARRDDRAARDAIRAAKRTEHEARGLAKVLTDRAQRTRLEAAIADARRTRRAARRVRRHDPRGAARDAAHAAALLERQAIRVGPGGRTLPVRPELYGGGRPLAAATHEARARVKAHERTVKRRRKRVEQVRKMSDFVAAHVLAQTTVAPTDVELDRSIAKSGKRVQRAVRSRG